LPLLRSATLPSSQEKTVLRSASSREQQSTCYRLAAWPWSISLRPYGRSGHDLAARPFLLPCLGLASALPAHAGPVVAAVSAVFSAFAASTVGAFLTTTFVGRLLTSIAISALSRLLQKRPEAPKQSGIKTNGTAAGGTNPCSFMLGSYATDGYLSAPPMTTNSPNGGTPNALLTYVIEIGDIAGQQLEALIVNNDYTPIEANDFWAFGRRILGRYTNNAWLRYYDGSQTTADANLVASYGSYPERPCRRPDRPGRRRPDRLDRRRRPGRENQRHQHPEPGWHHRGGRRPGRLGTVRRSHHPRRVRSTPMIINSQSLDSLRVGFRTEFQRGLGMAPPLRQRVAMVVRSTTFENRYGWLNKLSGASLALTTTTPVAIQAAAGAGIKRHMTSFWAINTGASIVDLIILDGATERHRYPLPPNVPVPCEFLTGIVVSTATALNAALSVAGTVRLNAHGYTAP
jgi:hypothetical protein